MKIRDLLKKEIIVLDGAMGTSLQRLGLKAGGQPELLNLEQPELVKKVHSSFINAGADIIYTNTFGANKTHFSSEKVREIVNAGVKIAKEAAQDRACVALDVGPIGMLFEPMGDLTFDKAYDIFKEIVIEGEKAGADLVVFETFSSLAEMRCAVLATKENTSLPIFTTMTFEKTGRTFTGVKASAFSSVVTSLGVDAVGVNCSLGPIDLAGVVEEIASQTDLPVIAKPNAGLPDDEGNYALDARRFAQECETLIKSGATIIGGCCGTTPEFISYLKQSIKNTIPYTRNCNKISVVCSDRVVVATDRPLIIGERLNPTGKKALKEAYLNQDIDYVTERALEQLDAGADLLDVNVGVPGVDEAELMETVVKGIGEVCSLPLSIDTTNPVALEKGLRAFVGKALVNSVNGEEKSLSTVLPIVKKYGASVIGLCLDEKGVPSTAEERLAIAKRIVDRATAIGIKKEDIVIDCLTLTVSAEQNQAMETLKAVKAVKEQLGVKTVLGVSNVSFGLPDRDRISSIFLAQALQCGLDYAIINPNSEAMAYAFRAHCVLCGYDKGAKEYIRACTDDTVKSALTLSVGQKSVPISNDSVQTSSLTKLMLNGMHSIVEETQKLLENNSPLEVVNKFLIPALDEVGKLYEIGKIFLPQLITSAETAKLGFDEVKKALVDGGNGINANKVIVMATVKGDVHDIGKNIVKMVLENYGYKVIDLGKNVDIEDIVNAVMRENAKLLGLSALMTTTVSAMEQTITEVKKQCPNCKIMVGGAVLTQEYANKINADFYASDANIAVKIAKEVFD